LYRYAVQLIKAGKAYVCDLTPQEMKEYRGTLTRPGKESPYRNRSVEENLDLFERMRAGEFPDGSRVLRAKIDMASGNLNMRDPALYRILRATHHRTGDRWCIYPMYDYAHPLSDSLEASPIPSAPVSLKTTGRCTTGRSTHWASTTRSRSNLPVSISATP
jgi:glutaminyl-tRNA synthetase